MAPPGWREILVIVAWTLFLLIWEDAVQGVAAFVATAIAIADFFCDFFNPGGGSELLYRIT